MEGFIERFDKENCCRQLALDYTYYFLFGTYPKIEENVSCTSIRKIIRLFEKKGACVKCNSNPKFWFNPVLLYFIIRSKCLNHRRTFGKKYVIISYSSALELYGIKDFWTHFICESIEDDKYEVYDPYYSCIADDYGMEVPPLSREKIALAEKYQIILWNGGNSNENSILWL